MQRSLKFVKYLPALGWEPVVVAGDEAATPVQDPSLLADLPAGTTIHRLGGFCMARLQGRWGQYGLGKLAVGINLLLQCPDATQFWARRNRAAVSRIVEQEKPELVYTTSGPYSNHLLGLWLKKRHGLPWFADFRDPWSKNLLTPYLPGYRRWNQRLERQVLAAADRVACVSEPWLEDLQANLGRETTKFVLLPNGYDEDDLQPLPAKAPDGPFTLAHIGSFYRNRRPDDLLAAVDLLCDSGRVPIEALQLLFIGKNARQHIPDRPPFRVVDYVPHKELDQYRAQSDVFLLILATTNDNLGNHSGKLFEYIAANRPILGIVTPGGVAQQLIEATCTGVAVAGDVEQIAAAIERLYQQWRRGGAEWQPNWPLIQQYTRRNLTGRLAAEFAQMLQESGDE